MRNFKILPLLLCAISTPAFAQSTATDGVYVFGDSSVEQGNLYALPGQSRAGSPYFAPDGFSRESNGPVWPELTFPGIKAVADPTARPNRVNFAFSGATSGGDNIALGGAPSLTQQVALFSSQAQAARYQPNRPDIFVIAAGTNDYIRDLLANGTLAGTPRAVASNLGSAATALSRAGARTILVEDIPNFWSAPAFRGEVPPTQDAEALRAVGAATADGRAQIIASLKTVRTANPGTNIVVVPVAAIYEHVRANATALGFTNITTACYDEAAGTLCSADPKVQNSYLFFDSLHLSARGQAIQAQLYNGLLGAMNGVPHRRIARQVDAIGAVADDLMTADYGDVQPGLSMIGDIAYSRTRGRSTSDVAGHHATRKTAHFGLGFGAESWSTSITGARIEGDERIDGGNSRYDLRGWGVTIANRRTIGRLALRGDFTQLWLGIHNGQRETGVRLVRAQFETRGKASFADFGIGWHQAASAWAIQPELGIRHERITRAAYAETGATGLNLNVARATDKGWRASAGLIVTRAPWKLGESFGIAPSLRLRYDWRLDDARLTTTSILADNIADPATTQGLSGNRRNLVIEPGLDAHIGAKAILSLRYVHSERRESRSDGARLGLRIAF